MIAPDELGRAAAALHSGAAVVLPNPWPLTSVVTATSAEVVNRAKSRPPEQSVALWVTDDDCWKRVASLIAAPEPVVALAGALLEDHLLTLLVPVTSSPAWAARAIRDGHMLLFGARWAPLRPLLAGAGTLHVSSANRTGRPPVASAAEARRDFPDTVHVLDADDGGAATGRSATTTIRLGRDGTLAHTRSGAQDRAHGGAEAYLDHLRRTYRVAAAGRGPDVPQG